MDKYDSLNDKLVYTLKTLDQIIQEKRKLLYKNPQDREMWIKVVKKYKIGQIISLLSVLHSIKKYEIR